MAFSHSEITPSVTTIVGSLLLVLGASTYLWCLWDFGTVGRGTPAPIDPPKQLVARGLYKYSRNPMYVGVLTVILGFAVLFRSGPIALYSACVATAFCLFVVFYEEPHLKRVFGSGYEEYCSRVPRWLSLRKQRAPD
jgi:protein-S-isoprenylcysteine O-methyltransferase Ste14